MNKTTIIICICVIVILLLILYIVLIHKSKNSDKKYPIIDSYIKLYRNCDDLKPFWSREWSLPSNLLPANYETIIGDGVNNICCIVMKNLEIKGEYEDSRVIKKFESFGTQKIKLDNCPEDYTISVKPYYV